MNSIPKTENGWVLALSIADKHITEWSILINWTDKNDKKMLTFISTCSFHNPFWSTQTDSTNMQVKLECKKPRLWTTLSEPMCTGMLQACLSAVTNCLGCGGSGAHKLGTTVSAITIEVI